MAPCCPTSGLDAQQIGKAGVRVCCLAEEHGHLADGLHADRLTLVTQFADGGSTFVLVQQVDLHLDEFMVLEGALKFDQVIFADPLVGDGEDGFQLMPDPAKMLFLVLIDLHAGLPSRVPGCEGPAYRGAEARIVAASARSGIKNQARLFTMGTPRVTFQKQPSLVARAFR